MQVREISKLKHYLNLTFKVVKSWFVKPINIPSDIVKVRNHSLLTPNYTYLQNQRRSTKLSPSPLPSYYTVKIPTLSIRPNIVEAKVPFQVVPYNKKSK
jgi:hypothetical protein